MRHRRLPFLLLGLATAALGAGLATLPRDAATPDATALPADHMDFPESTRCVDCHAPHHVGIGERIATWLARSHMTPRCLACHAFSGPSLAPHNRHFPDTDASAPERIECVTCHREHDGPLAEISYAGAAQCNGCHADAVTSFAHDHPPFDPRFPARSRTAIDYDHVTHATDYFAQAKFRKKAPRGCASCHTISPTPGEAVRTRAFEEACAACHLHQITGKDLVLFRLPAMRTAVVADATRLRAACGDATITGRHPRRGEPPFVSIGEDGLTPIMAYLLGLDADDADAYQDPVSALLLGMAEEGADALAALIEDRRSDECTPQLLAGLHRDVLRPAACAWIRNEEYTAGGEPSYGGWYTDALELRYRPMTPDDPVIKAWIELGLQASADHAADDVPVHAKNMLADLLSESRGAGRCAKCHALTATASDHGTSTLVLEWRYRATPRRPHTVFDHAAHARLSPKDRACESCHVLDPAANYASSFASTDREAFVSNFEPIEKSACVRCHEAGPSGTSDHGRGNECAHCHRYHLEPTLRRSMIVADESGEDARAGTP